MTFLPQTALRICRENLFLRFCTVGASGLVVDSLVLAFMLWLGAGPFIGRVASIWAAMTSNWALNRSFTFRSQGKPWPEYCRFVAVNLLGAGINYGIYSFILLSLPILTPFGALVIATACAVAFNFAGSKRYAFSKD